MIKHVFGIFVLVCIVPFLNGTNLHYITLEQNGYEGLTIGIDPKLETSGVSKTDIIENLKDYIKGVSDTLFEATGERAYFRKVYIVIPEDWTEIVIQEDGDRNWKESTIILRNGDANSLPSTVHGGGCGVEGSRIELPYEFYTESNRNIEISKKIFVQEWLKLRYGVFEEHGCIGDELYPYTYINPHTANLEQTTCTDPKEDTHFTWVDESSNPCTPSLGDHSCRPMLHNTTSTSSIMYTTADAIKHICTEDTHNSLSPTRQNKICKGKSVKEVMFQHRDFLNNNNSPGIKLETQFILTKPKQPKNIVLLIDNHCGDVEAGTDICGISGLSIFTELRSLFKNLLRERQIEKIGFGTYKGTSGIKKCSAESTILSYYKNIILHPAKTIDIDDLINFIPTDPDYKTWSTCSYRAIEVVLDDLKAAKDNGNVEGEVEIILLQMVKKHKTDVSPNDIAIDSTYGFHVHAVLHGPLSNNEDLEEFVKKTSGKFYSSQDYNPSILITAVGNLFNDDKVPQSLVHEIVNIENDGIGTAEFNINPSVGKDTTVIVTRYQEDKQSKITLTGPSEIPADVTEDTYVQFSVPVADPGTWKIKIEDSTKEQVYLSVRSKQKIDSDQIQIELWTSLKTNVVDLEDEPLILYASVRKETKPVKDLIVTAVMSTNRDNVDIPLSDMGGGDPDAQRDDGLYSGYVYNFGTLASVQEIKVNFGLKIQNKHSTLANTRNSSEEQDGIHSRALLQTPFMNMDSCGNVATNGVTDTIDQSFQTTLSVSILNSKSYNPPPSRVMDFRVVPVETREDTSGETVIFNMMWTEVGRDFMEGKVEGYEISYSNDPENVDKQIKPEDIVEGSLTPDKAGSLKSIKVELPKLTVAPRNYYFILQAHDEEGIFSDTSPMISFVDLKPPETTTSTESADTTKPGIDSTKPGTDTTEPVTDNTKPGTDTTEPETDSTKPGTDTTKPGTDNTGPEDPGDSEFVGSGGFWALIGVTISVVVFGIIGAGVFVFKKKGSQSKQL